MSDRTSTRQEASAASAALRGKVALVTGSSRGIGEGIARLFARHGATVAVHGRDAAAVDAVHDAITRDGGASVPVLGDVTRSDDLERMRDTIERASGPVDILVANAGGSFAKPGPLEEVPEDAWRATIDGNLTATFLTVKCFLGRMKERRSGNIITVSSSAARTPQSGAPVPYAAAKAGIQVLTQDLAAQVGQFGIRVNCIAPDTILTDRNASRIPPAMQQSLVDRHPLGRLGRVEDIAEAALFLASDESAWITGIVLDVAGGAVMR